MTFTPRTIGIFLLLLVCLLVETICAFSSVVAPSNKPTAAAANDLLSRCSDVEKTMREVHAREVAGGKDSFSGTATDGGDNNISSWSDDDFIRHDIGENNAGADASCLPKNGNVIFESRSPIVTAEECRFIVDEARETIARGLKEEEENSDESPEAPRANAISNSQLGEARLSKMPKTRTWLQETLRTRFYPLLKDRFGVDDVVLYDGLVLGNLAPTRSQPIHRDASLLTLNVALSPLDDYDGGGTYIEALDEILKIDQGQLLCHAGGAMHAGNAISRGERWVFVLFLLREDEPQLARRCHAEAIELVRQQRFDEAEIVLETGLASIAPRHDHLLYNTMGRLQVNMGQSGKALRSFGTAARAYPICHNAMVSMARILMDRRRPRTALRRLDVILERIRDRDLDPNGPSQLSLKSLAYGARRDAARCALICADHLYRTQSQPKPDGDETPATSSSSPLSSSSSSFAPWTRRHLPTAIDRLNTCLFAAPNEPSLLGMLNHAEFLLAEAAGEGSEQQ